MLQMCNIICCIVNMFTMIAYLLFNLQLFKMAQFNINQQNNFFYLFHSLQRAYLKPLSDKVFCSQSNDKLKSISEYLYE